MYVIPGTPYDDMCYKTVLRLQLANIVLDCLSASVRLAACGKLLKPRAIVDLCELGDDVYELIVTPAYCIF